MFSSDARVLPRRMPEKICLIKSFCHHPLDARVVQGIDCDGTPSALGKGLAYAPVRRK